MDLHTRVEKALKFFNISHIEGSKTKNPFVISSKEDKSEGDKNLLKKAEILFENFEKIEGLGSTLNDKLKDLESKLEKAQNLFGEQKKVLEEGFGKKLKAKEEEVNGLKEELQKAKELFKSEINSLKSEVEKIGETPLPSKSFKTKVEATERFSLQKGGKEFSLSNPRQRSALSNHFLSKVSEGDPTGVYSDAILKLESGAPLSANLVTSLQRDGINIVE